MTCIRKADPVAKRRIVSFLFISVIVGAVFFLLLERHRGQLVDWATADPEYYEYRVKIIIYLLIPIVSFPLLAFAAYLWRFGRSIIRLGEFPPPGYSVIRDTPVIAGKGAITRGKLIRLFGFLLGLFSIVIGIIFWRLGMAAALLTV